MSRFAQLAGGQFAGTDNAITSFATDSREVVSGSLFIAIPGAKVDGHEFVEQAMASGASGCLVEKPSEGPHILVPNIAQALANFARSVRSGYHGPVVAITGSAGKTTTKEMIAATLEHLGPVLKTEANRNTEYTAPLIWAELGTSTRAVVVEMGMRGLGQIRHLASFAKPTVGVITNIGVTHMELLGSRESIADAKAELLDALQPGGLAVLWHDDDFFETLRARAKCRVLTFGFGIGADCRIVDYRALSWTEAGLAIDVRGVEVRTVIPTIGRPFALNAAAALLVANELGGDIERAADALRGVKLPPLRMEVFERNGATIVLDAYNSNPPAALAALEALRDLPCEGRRLAVLGEMRELGPYSEEGHRAVGTFAAEAGIDAICIFGEDARWIGEAWLASGRPKSALTVARSIEEVGNFVVSVHAGDTVLIKGSRGLALERAVSEVSAH